MLEIERDAARQNALATYSTLQLQEVQLVQGNMNSISTQAALMLAVSFALIWDAMHQDEAMLGFGAEVAYFTCTATTFMIDASVVGLATVVSVLGPT